MSSGNPSEESSFNSADLSEANLRAMFVELRSVGRVWPYDKGSHLDIAALLNDVVLSLQHSPRLVVTAHRDHYGSGYASYVHLFCRKRGKTAHTNASSESQFEGIDLYLSRLAPIAALGAGCQIHYAGGGFSYTNLELANVGKAPIGEWTWELNELQTKLARHQFFLPTQEELSRKLSFELKAKRYRPSFSPSCVFDAIFFWDE